MVTTKGKILVVPSVSQEPEWFDVRGVRYADTGVPYLTTDELAKELSMYKETLWRWCRKWFGPLPAGRTGAKMGYRIPLEYRMVGRLWLMTEVPEIREPGRRAIIADPRNFLVVVANIGSTHYSVAEAVGRVETLLESPTFRSNTISTFYVGGTD